MTIWKDSTIHLSETNHTANVNIRIIRTVEVLPGKGLYVKAAKPNYTGGGGRKQDATIRNMRICKGIIYP